MKAFRWLMLLVFVLVLWSGQALAADYTLASSAQLYAQNASQAHGEAMAAKVRNEPSGWEKLHKYAGYTTVALAAITAASNSEEDFHESAAYATATSALTTVVAGLAAHGDRYDSSQSWLAEGNRHIVAGALGSALLVTAVAIADDGEEGSHSGLGVAGGVLMGLGVIDLKW